jgi:signal transduction histidine kinase/CheY-like chemotaxis protein
MPTRLLPLLVAPAILLPLALYAIRQRRVRGATWYAVLLIALAVWCAGYAWELSVMGAGAKVLALRVKYIGVLMMPVAWAGFILDFVARDALVTRRVVGSMGTVAAILLILAWTDGSHHLFWGDLRVEGEGSAAVLVGRGPGFWTNITITYVSLVAGIAVLVSQAVQSPYLYRKRVTILIVATLLPWLGNVLYLAGDEVPGTLDPTPFLFACTAVLAAVAVFRYGVLDPIPTLRDARIEIIGDALLILDPRRRIADLNRAAASMLGRSRAAAAGEVVDGLLPGLGEFGDRPCRVDLPRASASGDRVFDASITPIRTRDERLTGYVVLLRDVTEQRHLEEQLRQAQKMEAVGKLAGGVAHDFNNLLTAIIGFTSLASDELPIGSPVQDSLAQIRKSAEQAAALTRQLLAFGRRQILQPEVLDVGEVVVHVLPMLRRLIGEDITVTTDLQPGLPTIRADRTQVQQVLLNLAVNAREAMPLGGVVTIRTDRTHVDARDNGPDLAPGQYVVLEVTDTGHGVDSTMTDRIFEPFFTTKAFGQGTGLGLSTVYGIAKQSGGDVQVSSSPGRGATFRVLLPAAPSAALRLTPERRPAAWVPPTGPGTILLVEDDDAVRDFVTEVLRASGWVVVAVSTPAHALATAARQSLSIDLLVTDVVMPGMNGGELADKLVAMRPDLRVLFITGYDDDEVAARGLIEPRRECLSKPFTPSQLLARVEMLVSRAG